MPCSRVQGTVNSNQAEIQITYILWQSYAECQIYGMIIKQNILKHAVKNKKPVSYLRKRIYNQAATNYISDGGNAK
ncbi:hypothetical protein EBB54_09545 [Schaedlerella arabinosiphila]|uniref:Uncharacterized protein n=1 Tax=Schaedlerella arabinosiphila TaxID=2044587 RepID=A0A426DFP1_9FIRM|nr:hypothetical protein EBB54_09545 [Schaedlerella arabinosiphila]